MKLATDFRDLLSEFNVAGVEYLVLGGYAMAAHGFPRYTKDLDIFYNPTPPNVDRLIRALTAFGYRGSEITPEGLLTPRVVHYFGVPPLRVDLLNFAAGIGFEEAYAARVAINLDGVEVPIISLPMLMANKRASGRLQDLADVEKLEQASRRGQSE
jgi:predicted nucleotidyltransferase